MDSINFSAPVDSRPKYDKLEAALGTAFKQVMQQEFGGQLQDLVDYGCPHLGSSRVIERFVKQDGLVVLRRPVTSDTLMRVIYSNWSGLANKRGLGFLEFVLRMLWTDKYNIVPLYHSIALANRYPTYLADEPLLGYFLTSRILIRIDDTVDVKEIAELAPIIRKLVPARTVVRVVADALNIDAGTKQLGICVAYKNYQVVDLS